MILVIHSNQAINEGNNPAVDRFLKNINEEKWRVLKKTSPRIAHKLKRRASPPFQCESLIIWKLQERKQPVPKMLLALVWLVERAFDLQLLPF